MDYLKIEDMEEGEIYVCEGRNFDVGRWIIRNDEKYVFNDGIQGIRYKFGDRFLDVEIHWDADPRYGTIKPFRKATLEEAKAFNEECQKLS